jgi:Fur family ferric uptake transcriptional regulator
VLFSSHDIFAKAPLALDFISRSAPHREAIAMKSDLAAIRYKLAARGHRITKQRIAIIREFAAEQRYVTANDLFDRLERKRAGIGLATVYRTLEALHAVGAASPLAQSNRETAYLFCPIDHHHHAVCTKCGKVEDVRCRSVARFERALNADLHFRLTQHRMEFFGVCARCS